MHYLYRIMQNIEENNEAIVINLNEEQEVPFVLASEYDEKIEEPSYGIYSFFSSIYSYFFPSQ